MVTRIRRGKVVVVPPQWVGKFPTKKTMRDRPSQLTGKLARRLRKDTRYKDARALPLCPGE